ncbi:MAG: hypothetical protein ACRDZ4_18600 [Egibacteraceae bacterium]
MSEQRGGPPDTARVEQGEGAMIVFTPCHSAQVLLPPEQAVPDEALCVVCPRDGIEWNLQLVADEAVPSGLRAIWTAPEPGQ